MRVSNLYINVVEQILSTTKIKPKDLLDKFSKYKVWQYIEQCYDDLSSRNIESSVLIIKEYIKNSGGNIQ